MLTALSFVFVLGVLIFFHELGHFLVAKRVGIRVDRFSLGFPPNIFKKKYKGTEYCIGLIPLGGFVKMAGENPDEEPTGLRDEFMSKSVLQRAAVIFAGPFTNYLLAILVMIGVYYFTGVPFSEPGKILVGQVSNGSPAEAAGLSSGDLIIAIDGTPVTVFDSLRNLITAVVEKPIEVTWIRGKDTISKSIVTKMTEIPNVEGGIDTVGMIGFTQKIAGFKHYTLGESLIGGFMDTQMIVAKTFSFVKQVAIGEVSFKMLGGPLFIAQQSGREASEGPSRLFLFMALLSVNLAVLNVLPIPVLDGGHLVFLAIEAIKGSPLSMKVRMMAQQVGVLALLSLIVFVTYNDIMRFFGDF